MSADHGSEMTGGKIFGLGLGAGGAVLAFLGLSAVGIGMFGPMQQRYPGIVLGGIAFLAVGAAMAMSAQKKAGGHPPAKKEEKKEEEKK